jgi:hypothetical protein
VRKLQVFLLAGWFVASVSAAGTQTNFYTTVTNLWYQGHKSNLLEMVETRIQQNTNDIAGLIIKADFDIAFTRDDTISNSVKRVLEVGSTILTTNFANVFPDCKTNLLGILEDVSLNPLSGEELLKEQAKGNFKHTHLLSIEYLEALLKDGYFD